MALTQSRELPLGTQPPAFNLPDTDGSMVSLSQFSQSPLLVVNFICNHCPFVKHIANAFAEVADKFQTKGVSFIAINSNDVVNYPEDSPEKMREEKANRGYNFPYLFDETQEVAKSYHAVCTPDLFVFARGHGLVYHGQFDSSRPGQGNATGEDLYRALDQLLKDPSVKISMKPSIGCNIKWKS